MKKVIESCISRGTISLIDAMERIQKNGKGVLYIVDEKGIFIGSVTDGDIRRWIISTGRIDGNVDLLVNKEAQFIWETDSIEDEGDILRRYQVRSLPVLDPEKKIKDIIFDEYYKSSINYGNSLEGVPVIIMAGGKGTRLYPYTKILPKPLIPIGDVPIVERIMNRFHQYGAQRFYLIVNYKKEMIKSYFMDGSFPFEIEFIEEDKPLGTAGGIRLITKHFDSPVMITNCDTLVEADYEEIVKTHKREGNDLTIVSSIKKMVIPYGVLDTGVNGKVNSMEEKPHLSFMVNTGMYMMNPEIIKWIPKGREYGMNELTQSLVNEKKSVGIFPISERSFMDMGELEEMKKMEYRIQTSR